MSLDLSRVRAFQELDQLGFGRIAVLVYREMRWRVPASFPCSLLQTALLKVELVGLHGLRMVKLLAVAVHATTLVLNRERYRFVVACFFVVCRR